MTELDQAYEHDYQEKRLFIAKKLQEKYPDQKLINFHFTAGTRNDVTKEELWAQIEQIHHAPYREVTAAELDDEIRVNKHSPVCTNKTPIDLKERVKQYD